MANTRLTSLQRRYDTTATLSQAPPKRTSILDKAALAKVTANIARLTNQVEALPSLTSASTSNDARHSLSKPNAATKISTVVDSFSIDTCTANAIATALSTTATVTSSTTISTQDPSSEKSPSINIKPPSSSVTASSVEPEATTADTHRNSAASQTQHTPANAEFTPTTTSTIPATATATATLAPLEPKPTLLGLPKELLLKILLHHLECPNSLPINPDFSTSTPGPPQADYRVLHTCHYLYTLGLPIYYRCNTFSISLRKFGQTPETYAPGVWPRFTGQAVASQEVRRLQMRCRGRPDDWVYALRALRAFCGDGVASRLEGVVFDLRMAAHYDDTVEGVRTCGEWVREERVGRGFEWVSGSFGWTLLRVDAGSELGLLLVEVGLDVSIFGSEDGLDTHGGRDGVGNEGRKGIWIAGPDLQTAMKWRDCFLIDGILRAFETLEEFKGLNAGGMTRKKWGEVCEERWGDVW